MTENLCRKSIKNAVEVKEYQILYHLRELRQQIGNAKMTCRKLRTSGWLSSIENQLHADGKLTVEKIIDPNGYLKGAG